MPRQAVKAPDLNTRAFTIQVSPNGTNFATLVTVDHERHRRVHP